MKSFQQAVKYKLPDLEADEKKCFEVIEKHIRVKGFAPSIPETAKALGKPKSFGVVQRLREQLRKKGCVTWQNGKYRSLQIVAKRK